MRAVVVSGLVVAAVSTASFECNVRRGGASAVLPGAKAGTMGECMKTCSINKAFPKDPATNRRSSALFEDAFSPKFSTKQRSKGRVSTRGKCECFMKKGSGPAPVVYQARDLGKCNASGCWKAYKGVQTVQSLLEDAIQLHEVAKKTNDLRQFSYTCVECEEGKCAPASVELAPLSLSSDMKDRLTELKREAQERELKGVIPAIRQALYMVPTRRKPKSKMADKPKAEEPEEPAAEEPKKARRGLTLAAEEPPATVESVAPETVAAPVSVHNPAIVEEETSPPVESAPVESAPVESAPVESAPVEEETPAVVEEETPAVVEEETPAAAEEETPAAVQEQNPAPVAPVAPVAERVFGDDDEYAEEDEDEVEAKEAAKRAAELERNPLPKSKIEDLGDLEEFSSEMMD